METFIDLRKKTKQIETVDLDNPTEEDLKNGSIMGIDFEDYINTPDID